MKINVPKTIYISVIILFLVLIPSILFAQDAGGLVPCDGPDCDFEDFTTGINKLINWFILVGGSASAIGFAWVGWIYMTEGASPGKREAANEIFRKIAIGFFFLLASWLIVKLILLGLGADDVFNLYLS